LLNLSAAEGHPASVMDMSFANQILSIEYLLKENKKLANKVYSVPSHIDEKIALLIGKRGQTLDSLQYLVNLVANRFSEQYIRIILDAENYRDRRKESLEHLAKRLGNKAVRTRKEVILEPMNALERKIIHTVLQDIRGVKTYSEGVEPNRRIVVAPAK